LRSRVNRPASRLEATACARVSLRSAHAGWRNSRNPRCSPCPPNSPRGAVLTFIPKNRSSTPGALTLSAGAEPSPGYRLRRVRGRGGFAEVWEADAPEGPPVALKFMPSSNASTTARELRSIQSFQTMDHPYLVKTYGVWSVPGYIVINMELAEATLLD